MQPGIYLTEIRLSLSFYLHFTMDFFMNLGKNRIWIVVLGAALLSTLPFFIVWNKISRVSKLHKFIVRDQNAEILALKGAAASFRKITSELRTGTIALPSRLSKITSSEKLGVVKNVRTIHFDSEFPKYNPSIIEREEGGYHLFFRHDEPKNVYQSVPFHSYIGCADLDKDFTLRKVVEKLNTGSRFSEDPRVVRVGKDLFVSWNDQLDSDVYCRTIHSAKWDPKTYTFEYITNLDQHIQWVEKNWVPFERWEKNVPHLGFIYAVQPHKILDVPHPEKNEVVHLISQGDAALSKLKWGHRWGRIGGGSTARLIEGEYISFFHSSFREPDGLIWYVMGAYTFEAAPPHRITSISRCPILFPGIYESEFLNTADPSKKIIYPAGIAVEKKGEDILLHVSCGENDSAVKIVTIDYHTLKKHMVLPQK